jgi:triosephosphate isomerase
MKKLIAGNWKMNGSSAFTAELMLDITAGIDSNPNLTQKCDFLVCPPSPYLQGAKLKAGRHIEVGAQDCSNQEGGAYTGEVAASMISDIGINYVILGHSERREYHKETDAIVAQKAERAHAKDLITIICVGESEAQREAGKEKDVVKKQILGSLPSSANTENVVIAYEPVWAIGTGKTASVDDVKVMHAFIRDVLQEKLDDSDKIRILYGGSVKPANAEELFNVDHVNGALIGGASLNAEDFLGIAKAAPVID